jgi:hypothetical protein
MAAFRCGYCRKDVDSCVVRHDILDQVHHEHPTIAVVLCHRCNAIWNTSQEEARRTMAEVLLETCNADGPSPEDDALARRVGLPRFDIPNVLAND